MSYLYLASPYTHPDASVREMRYLDALDALNWLVGNRIWTYSPIVHCHHLSAKYTLPGNHEFWQDYNHLMILNSRGMMLLQLPGWKESNGVTDELDYADHLGIPVTVMQKEGSNYATFKL
jgi:hypothetical protein